MGLTIELARRLGPEANVKTYLDSVVPATMSMKTSLSRNAAAELLEGPQVEL